MSRTSIETVTGRMLDFSNPTADMVSVQSIGWGLSRQPRFSGQTVGQFPYSVAQHSVYVMELIRKICTPGSRLNLFCRSSCSERLNAFLSSSLSLKKYGTLAMILGLFHDGSEAFLCDLPTPAKRLPGLMEAYSSVEMKLMAAIHEHLKITPEMILPELQELVHWADQYALSVEVHHLVPSAGQNEEWAFLHAVQEEDLNSWPAPVDSSEKAYSLFLKAYVQCY